MPETSNQGPVGISVDRAVGNPPVPQRSPLPGSAPSPDVHPTPDRHVGGLKGRLAKIGLALGIAGAGTAGAYAIANNNNEHNSAVPPVAPTVEPSPTGGMPSATAPITTPEATYNVTTPPAVTQSPSPEVTPTATTSASPTESTQPSPSTGPEQSLSPDELLQQNLNSWIDGSMQINGRWSSVGGGTSYNYGLDKDIKTDGHNLGREYLGYLLGANSLPNGEVVAYVGMEAQDGGRFFVPFRVSDPGDYFAIQETSSYTATLGGVNPTTSSSFAFAEKANGEYNQKPVIIDNPFDSTGWKGLSKAAIDQSQPGTQGLWEYANAALKNGLNDVQKRFPIDQTVDESNVTQLPWCWLIIVHT